MPVCDICNSPGVGTIISAENMRQAVFKKGFNPLSLGLVRDPRALMNEVEWYIGWKNTIVAQDTSDWNVCPNCMAKLNSYLEGTLKPTGVMTATVTRDPIVSKMAGAAAEQKYKRESSTMNSREPTAQTKITKNRKGCIPIGILAVFLVLAVIGAWLWLGGKNINVISSPFVTQTPTITSFVSATFTPTATPQPTPTKMPTSTATPLPVEVTFDTIGDYPTGQLVILVGRIALLSSTTCSLQTCGLLLENPAKPSQKMTIFVTVGTNPNQMKPLPDNYTKSDIQVYLNDGSIAVVYYRIRVTGRVCTTKSNEPCISDIVKIELFQVK